MIEPYRSGPPKFVAKENAKIDALNKGQVYASEDSPVIAEPQPDGRVMLRPRSESGSDTGNTISVPAPPASGNWVLTAQGGGVKWEPVEDC